MINFYTDGSVQKNGKPEGYAGWACVCIDNPEKKIVRYGHFKPTSTNGRGEIGGVLYGITMVTLFPKPIQVNFISDAQYVVNSLTTFRHNQKKYNYAGIKNQDLLVPMYQIWEDYKSASIEWVKGHSGVPGNELADVWAGHGCREHIVNQNDDGHDIRFVTHEEFDAFVARALRKALMPKTNTMRPSSF